MLVGILEFVVILILSIFLTFIVLFQDYCMTNIKINYSETMIGIIVCIMHIFLGTWITFFTETNLIAISKTVAIQLTISLFLWFLSKYVQKYEEKWFITLIGFIIYGTGTYLYVTFAFRGY
ncbi:TPA: hypothetical protein ROX88_001031 [Bacillus pseudomycoides]|nr:hypothetical protein [Bacillus pseudomycoides]